MGRGHQHTAVCVASLPCSSGEDAAAASKALPPKQFLVVASYHQREGAEAGDTAQGGDVGLQLAQGLLSFFEVRQSAASDSSGTK